MPRIAARTNKITTEQFKALQKRSEHQEQVAFFEMVRAKYNQYPHWKTIHAIPNGGKRHISVAKKLKAEGVVPGIMDICCPFARGKYISLRIEMKIKGNTTSAIQKEMIKAFEKLDNCVFVCYSGQDAFKILEEYEELGKY